MKLPNLIAAVAFGSLMSITAAQADEATPKNGFRRSLAGEMGKKSPKGPKLPSECPTCEQLLPSFYFADQIIAVEEGSTDRADLAIDFITFIFDVIYGSDTLKCLLLSIIKTARDIVCFIQDEQGIPNPSTALFDATDAATRSIGGADGKITATTDDAMIAMFQQQDVSTMSDFASMMDIDVEEMFDDFQRDRIEVGKSVDDFLKEALSPELEQQLIGASFGFKCLVQVGLGFVPCLVIFSILRTLDASICHYQEERGCTIDKDCTKDLKFTIDYKARRLGNYIPFIFGIPGTNLILGDILAPCGLCIEEKYKCAAYCNYADGFSECNPFVRASLDEIF